ncbi:MAG: RIP metalloprotease RseP [Gammaproteobacteria bacterium]|nr:MAG: RIP metalloprotease RseP [Gammaproteobacteria bacterium]
MTSFMWSIGGMIVALGLLVTVHEFGHFYVARKVGVRVLRFSIGFGKPLWRWQKTADSTEYVIAAVPLGGYVKMLGEAEEEVSDDQAHEAFNNKALWRRVAIVAAGPLANFFLAILLFWCLYVTGVSGLKPIVGDLQADSLAAQAGFREGDQIVAIGDEQVVLWDEVGLQLLTQAVAGAEVPVGVVTIDGDKAARWLDFSQLPVSFENTDMLSGLGLKPAFPELPAVINEVMPGEAAALAGLRSGDRLLNADGETIADWSAWVDYVRARPEQLIMLELEREGVQLSVEITPVQKQEGGEPFGRIGAGPLIPDGWYDDYRATRRYGPLTAVGKAVSQTGEMTLLTLKMLGKMVTGEVSLKNINGPISIAEYAGKSAQIGVSAFLKLVAFLSISIGIFNLLPIPVLDGGHLLYYFAEWVRGKPLSESLRGWGQQGGLVILLGLTFLALYNDIHRLLQ